MKLSEAILLGSTIVKAKAGRLYSSETEEGCALGMAAIVVGCTFAPAVRPMLANDRRTLNIEDVWGDWVLRVVMRTCECSPLDIPHKMRIKDVIAHLFDYHVMGKKDWTLDQLVAWVETWEPKGPDPMDMALEILERRSQLQPAEPSRAEDESRGADEWQERVSDFTARHNSERRRRRPAL